MFCCETATLLDLKTHQCSFSLRCKSRRKDKARRRKTRISYLLIAQLIKQICKNNVSSTYNKLVYKQLHTSGQLIFFLNNQSSIFLQKLEYTTFNLKFSNKKYIEWFCYKKVSERKRD